MSPLAECWPATERRAEEESWESPHAGETQLGSTGTQQHQPHQPEVTCRHHNRYLYTVDIRWLELAGNILALVRSRQRQARSGLYKSSKHLMKTLISMQVCRCQAVVSHPCCCDDFWSPFSNLLMSVDCCVGKCVLLLCPRSDWDSRLQFS